VAGRVYLADFSPSAPNKGTERALCLDEKSGKILWADEWDADYTGLQQTYATGPRATPTVDGDRVYVLGASGRLRCLESSTGRLIWSKDFVRDYGTRMPVWGIAGAPLVVDGKLVCLTGGENAKVVAFDKLIGKELWRALPSDSEPGYVPPFLVNHNGRRQIIIWHATAVSSLDPDTGKVNWEQPFRTNLALVVATPVQSGPRLLVSAFYNGSMMLDLAGGRMLWKGNSASEINTDGLHSLISTPVVDGDYVYGICSYGQLRCLNARTGQRVWETLDLTREQARWSTGHIVRNGDRYFINTDRGDLVIARLTPQRYEEISRTRLIKPTSRPGNRRELGAVAWSHPAYANRRIFVRNDEEILCADLAAR
jgi:glucose dehydrogenase